MLKRPSRDRDRAHANTFEMADCCDYISGEDFEAILNILEEDEDIQEEFEQAIADVQTGEFICHTCGKKCKSNSGLKRHTSAKHGDGAGPISGNVDELTTDLLAQIVKETTLKLSKNACYSMAARDELVSYNMSLGKEADEMKMLQKLYSNFQRKGNVERFYTEYYSEVPLKATNYFPHLSEKTATFLATKVADHMLTFAKKKVVDMNQPTGLGETTTTTSLSEREISGGQYIGGYVFHNLHKKLKSSPKWKSPESQQAISILEAARVTDSDDQKLISCLNRGGLWAINSQAQDIIFKTEQLFRELTRSIEGNKLEINTILCRSLSCPDILSAFNNLTANAELEPEKHVAMDTLNAIIHLYVKVRAFSLAKDLVHKYKLAAKSKSKQKALRKEIQRASDPPPNKT